jgi:asparagine synthase (glutamine-hydrolysing)
VPGIVGIISSRPPVLNEGELEHMVAAMNYEKFYVQGYYTDDHLGVYAGWVVRQNGFSDCLPIFNSSRDVALIFDGENFLNDEVAAWLATKDYGSDREKARYIIHLYEEQGNEFLGLLNGWFCGLLVDRALNKLILFNDRFCMRKLYYHQSKEAFYFASEAKALLAVRPELREFDLVGLGEHLGVNCTFHEKTLFKGISRLPGGAEWTWHGRDKVRKTTYFNAKSWEEQPTLSSKAFYLKFKETFLKILPRYFGSDGIAMSLTAGLDSRMILAGLSPAPDQMICFTLGGVSGDTLDILRARETAQICRQPHQVVRLNQDFFTNFDELASNTVFITDGSLDVCNSHDLYFNRIIRQLAPVRMTGKFGSEVVRNRNVFKPAGVNQQVFDPAMAQWINRATDTLKDVRTGHPVTMSVFKGLPWNEYGKLAIELSQLALRTPYMDNELVQVVYQAPPDVRASDRTQLRLIEECNPILRSVMTNRGTAGSSKNLVSLCSQLFYYSLLKADYIYLYGMSNWMIRLTSLLAPLGLERLFLGKQKYEHYRLWLRDKLASFVKDVLFDERTLQRPFFNKKFVRNMAVKHINGTANYFLEINNAITLELITRELFERWSDRPENHSFIRSGAITRATSPISARPAQSAR